MTAAVAPPVARVEAHAVAAWPAAVCEPWGDGWLLRATPGLARARSNHALTPCERVLWPGELGHAVAATRAFASRHGTPVGIQVSPRSVHAGVADALVACGWSAAIDVRVLAAPVAAFRGSAEPLGLVGETVASPQWLSVWAECEGRSAAEVEAHASTVFAWLAGRAVFWRSVDAGGGEDRAAVGVSVERDGLIGLFCLAVAPDRRRRGLGAGLVRGILAGSAAETAYLQVESTNAGALALYDRLGFEPLYEYVHCVAPVA